MSRTRQQCTHLGAVKAVTPSGEGCQECLAMGDTWVHLRLCRTCGHVGCCDDSKNRHARKHFVAITNAEKFGTQPFPQPGPNTTRFVPASSDAPQPKIEASHLTIGPSVGSIAASPTDKLSDPGVGLNDNGRRVLSYADLRALYPGVDGRPPTRQIELHLTGNMERYIWGFDGYRFSEAEPVHLELGERVRIVLINDTMMEHPIHLHGLWGELENGQGEYRPFKHTITVKPAERLSYLVSADTPGRWAYHCHLLYHMTAGMFRVLVVS